MKGSPSWGELNPVLKLAIVAASLARAKCRMV